jgi:hypothetical protein
VYTGDGNVTAKMAEFSGCDAVTDDLQISCASERHGTVRDRGGVRKMDGEPRGPLIAFR